VGVAFLGRIESWGTISEKMREKKEKVSSRGEAEAYWDGLGGRTCFKGLGEKAAV